MRLTRNQFIARVGRRELRNIRIYRFVLDNHPNVVADAISELVECCIAAQIGDVDSARVIAAIATVQGSKQ